MAIKSPLSTTEMQVTSIRLERSLIDKLKEMAGSDGYQSLVRSVLWAHVNQNAENAVPQIALEDIRSVMAAEARQQERCALTGQRIEPFEEMWLALTTADGLVPLSVNSLDEAEAQRQ